MWALGTVKLSVIFFYRSIFRGRAFNLASWSMVCIVLSWFLGSFCAVAFQCGSQFFYLWSSAANVASHCTKGVAVSLGLSIPDVITDGLILAVPLYWVSDSRSAASQTSSRPADMETANVFLEETQCLWSFLFRCNVSNPRTDPDLWEPDLSLIQLFSTVVASIIRLVVYVIIYPSMHPCMLIALSSAKSSLSPQQAT